MLQHNASKSKSTEEEIIVGKIEMDDAPSLISANMHDDNYTIINGSLPATNKQKRYNEEEALSSYERHQKARRDTNPPEKLKLDEFESFASNVIAQLRNMPFEEALKLQLKIQALITEERLRYMEDCKRQGKCAEASSQVFEPIVKIENSFGNYGSSSSNRDPLNDGVDMA